MAKEAAVPLLDPLSHSGTASTVQTLGNIIVSDVGTGVLGLPFAFRIAGWLAGSVRVIFAGLSTYYCMLLLVECRDIFQEAKEYSSSRGRDEVKTYSDLGYKAWGKTGRYLTEFLIVISQCGGSVAYLVFIAQNLSSIFTFTFSFSSFILVLIPIQITLSWILSLSSLSPFSVFADICNVLAMAIVLKEDLGMLEDLSERKAIRRSVGGLPFSVGVTVFCFEGFGMTLALESSMKERRRFRWILGLAFTGITLLYVCFGFFGYLAYGDQTADIVTLNLPDNHWSTTAVKVGLCVGLTFTFPIMMHPIHEIAEAKLRESGWFRKLCYSSGLGVGGGQSEWYMVYVNRALVVVTLAMVALFVPGFGVFVSLVGGTVCALLSFVLPVMFHLIFMGSSLGFWKRSLDVVILICGLALATYSIYSVAVGSAKGQRVFLDSTHNNHLSCCGGSRVLTCC